MCYGADHCGIGQCSAMKCDVSLHLAPSGPDG